MSHEKVAEFDVGGPEGTIYMSEYKCSLIYVTVERGSNYCPNCGEKL